MHKVMIGIAALTLLGTTAVSVPASAADHQAAAATHAAKSTQASGQITELSAQRRYYRHHYGYWGPRYRHRYWGPRYGYRYWGPRYGYGYGGPRYGYYGYPYYAYHPGVRVGIGPFRFGFF